MRKALLGGGEIAGFGFLDQRADPIDAAALVDRAADRIDHLVEAIERNRAGVDRLAARGLLAQLRDVHVAEIGEHQRARDRRRGHHENVDGLALARERQALMHAEAMLLVDDREREVAEFNLLLEQRVGADQKIDLARLRAAPAWSCARVRARGRSGSQVEAPTLPPAARWSCGAGARGFRSAPSAPPAARLRSTAAAASRATTVLPDPTSPCSMRSMRSGLPRSATIASIARCCDRVSE